MNASWFKISCIAKKKSEGDFFPTKCGGFTGETHSSFVLAVPKHTYTYWHLLLFIRLLWKNFFVSCNKIPFDKEKHTKITRTSETHFCNKATLAENKRMLALCPASYKKGSRNQLGDPIDELHPDKAAKTTICLSVTEGGTQTSSPMKDGSKEEKAASPKKRCYPQNCNVADEAKSPWSKRFKVHQ